ncbi:MAG TPA: FecR family protein [Spirochaetia bacterium]
MRYFPLILLVALVGAPAALAALDGQVAYIEGSVSLSAGGGASVDAAIGDAFGDGAVFTTGAASLAILDLGNGTTVKLKEKTTLAVDSIGDAAAVSLRAGGVFTSIARKLVGSFTLRTSTAVAGVRGTEFFVSYGRTTGNEPDVWLCVNRGSVEVSLPATGQSVLVNEGLGIDISGGATITPPRRYPWTRSLNWNTDPRAGSVVDTTSLDRAYTDLLNHDYN